MAAVSFVLLLIAIGAAHAEYRPFGHFPHQDFPFSFPNFGQQIHEQIARELAPLQGLGERIKLDVSKNLESVRRMELRQRILKGLRGITMVTFEPSGQSFLIQDGNLYRCPVEHMDSANYAECTEPFHISEDQDFCYTQANAVINDFLCFTSTGDGISMSNINGHITCSARNHNAKVLGISKGEYAEKCKSIAATAHYTYLTQYFDDITPSSDVNCSRKEQLIECHLDDLRKSDGQYKPFFDF